MASRRQILIVEDEPFIAWNLADMVRDLGHEVCGIVATEGAAVKEASRCDAVLMDFRLAEGGSGLNAARKIREHSDMPIVFCTAFAGEPALAEQMTALPRAAMIAKPVSSAQLKAALGQLLDS